MSGEVGRELMEAARLTTRSVRSGRRDGRPTRIVVAARRYRADRDDVWDAVTNPDRLPRWFLPVSGELRVGGHYQFEGNAGGTVEACRPPSAADLTWEVGGELSWVRIRLLPSGPDETELTLEHEALADAERWQEFGPGAVGVGWDLGLTGLGPYLATGKAVDQSAAMEVLGTPPGSALIRSLSRDWARAAVADGEDPDQAEAAAQRTATAYGATGA